MTSAKLDDGSIDLWNTMTRAGFNDSPINLWTLGPSEAANHGSQGFDGNQSFELTRNGDSTNQNQNEVNESAIGLSRTQTNTKEDDKDTYAHGFTLFTVVLSLVMSLFLASLDMTILATAIPRITAQFHSLNDVGWYGSVFFLTVASSQPVWGKAYKFFDLKTVFMIGITVFEVGSLICGVAQNSKTLIVGRAITGVGAAGVIAGCFTIIAFSVAPMKRPAFTGILGATYGVSSVVGPLIGGALTDNVGWRWCFYINLPIGGVSAAIILFTFKTPKASRLPKVQNMKLLDKIIEMDLVGFFLIIAAVICYLLAAQWGGVTKAWNSADVIGLLVGFGLIILVFIAFEMWLGERGILVPHILKKRFVWVACAFNFFLAGSFFVLLYYLPIYFQAILGANAGDSGIRNIALIIPVMIFEIATGVLMSKLGYAAPFLITGAVITTIGMGVVYANFGVGTSSAVWIGLQVLSGVGIGLAYQAPMMNAEALATDEDMSSITSIILFFQSLGGAFLISAAQSIFENRMSAALAKNTPGVNSAMISAVGATGLREGFSAEQLPGILASYMEGLSATFALCIALAGMACCMSLFMPWTSLKTRAAAHGGGSGV